MIALFSLLMTCIFQMEDIRLPMTQGTMDDISQEGEGSQDTSSTGESMSSQGAKAIYEREAQIMLDYSALDDEYKEVGRVIHFFLPEKFITSLLVA